jgi:hypothetical protein
MVGLSASAQILCTLLLRQMPIQAHCLTHNHIHPYVPRCNIQTSGVMCNVHMCEDNHSQISNV